MKMIWIFMGWGLIWWFIGYLMGDKRRRIDNANCLNCKIKQKTLWQEYPEGIR